MIRYLYSIGIAIGCMGLPLQAKGIAPVTEQPVAPAKTKKTETKTVATSNKPTTGVTSSSTTSQDKAKNTVAKTSNGSTKSVASTSTARPGSTTSSNKTLASSSHKTEADGRLARLTAYWAGEGDYYTGRCMSSTGIRLHGGHCAVDPRIIPYGSVVTIPGLGNYLAVDTGSAVISREAAREAAHNEAERNALVIDLFFESRRDGEHFANSGPKYAPISWTTPTSVGANTQETHSLLTE